MSCYVENFLEDRTFRVIIGNTLSTLRMLENGVPQGTVMPVTAFLIRMTEVEAFIPYHTFISSSLPPAGRPGKSEVN